MGIKIACPFCETGVLKFDLEGLKFHLFYSCGAFASTLTLEQEVQVAKRDAAELFEDREKGFEGKVTLPHE